jgi:hypothetical protein
MNRTLVIAGLLALMCGRARAADQSADDLIARGLELRRASKPVDALEMFQRAHALSPSPRTLGQMGLVETSLEHWMDADAHLAATLSTPEDPWVKKNRAFLDQALGVCRGHIGELAVTGPDGTDVAVDGKHVGTLPAMEPVRLVEGNVVVTANSNGFKDFSKTVAIAGGSKTSLAIVLDPMERRPAVALSAPTPLPAAPGAASVAVDERRPSRARPVIGTGLIAAGAALLTWGVVWIAIDGNDVCSTGGPACLTVRDTKTGGWILTAAGAAAAAGGTVLLLTGRHREGSSVAIGVTPTSLSLGGRF